MQNDEESSQPHEDPSLSSVQSLSHLTQQMTISNASVNHEAADNPFVATPLAPHPPTGDNTITQNSTIQTTHSLPRTRSFHIEIEANGQTLTGEERSVPTDADFPRHFETITVPPPSPTLFLPQYDIDVHAIPIEHNVLRILQQPITPFNMRTHVTCGDTAIINSDRLNIYRVVGIYEITPGSNNMTYIFYNVSRDSEMYVEIPKEWSGEVDWSWMIDTGF
jgi:hypothetical protein